MMVAGSFQRLSTCSQTSASGPPKNRPDQLRNTRACSRPPVVSTYERLRLILRRERADPLLLLRRSCDFALSFRSSLLRSRQLLRFSLSLSLSFRCSGFGVLFSLRSTHSCTQEAAAFPSCFNFFSTFRTDQGTSMSFARRVHTTPIPPPRLRNQW